MEWTSLFNVSNYIVISDHSLEDSEEEVRHELLNQAEPAPSLLEDDLTDFLGILLLPSFCIVSAVFVVLTILGVRKSRHRCLRIVPTHPSADAASDKQLRQIAKDESNNGNNSCEVAVSGGEELLNLDNDNGHESDSDYRRPDHVRREFRPDNDDYRHRKRMLTSGDKLTVQQTIDVIDVVADARGDEYRDWSGSCTTRTGSCGVQSSMCDARRSRTSTLGGKRSSPRVTGRSLDHSRTSTPDEYGDEDGSVCCACLKQVRPSFDDSRSCRETSDSLSGGSSHLETDRWSTSGIDADCNDSTQRRSSVDDTDSDSEHRLSVVNHHRNVRSRSTSDISRTSIIETGHRSRALDKPLSTPVTRSLSAPPASSPFSPLNSFLFLKAPFSSTSSMNVGGHRHEYSAATVLFGAVKTWLGGGLLSVNPFPWSLSLDPQTSRSKVDEQDVLPPLPDHFSQSISDQSPPDCTKMQLAAAHDELWSAAARVEEMTKTVMKLADELQLIKRRSNDRELEWRSQLETSENTGQLVVTELERARSHIEQLEGELSRRSASVATTMVEAELETKRVADAASSKVCELQAANQTMSAELEKARSRIAELTKRLDEANENHEVLAKRMSEQQTQIALQRSHMKKQLADQRKSELEQKQVESQRNDSAMREQLARHETEIEQRHSRITQLECELDRTAHEMNHTKSDLGRVKEELRSTQVELERVSSKLVESTSVRHAVEHNASLVGEKLTRVTVELGRVKDDLERLSADRRRLESALSREELRRGEVESELSTTACNLGRVVDELGQVRRKLGQVQAEFDNSMSLLEESENERRAAILEASKAKTELDLTEAEVRHLKENMCISRVDQKRKFNEMNARTLQIAEELSSLRCYSDLLRAKLNGSAQEQQERMAMMRQRVIDYDKRRAASAAVSLSETQNYSDATCTVCHQSQQRNTSAELEKSSATPVSNLLEKVDNMRNRCLRELSDTATRQSDFG